MLRFSCVFDSCLMITVYVPNVSRESIRIEPSYHQARIIVLRTAEIALPRNEVT